jgi:Tfp pilus assembly protein PilZ
MQLNPGGTVMKAVAYSERRRFARKSCALNVGLDDYEHLSSGRLHNLSRGGAYIETQPDFPIAIGEELIVTIMNKRKGDFLILKSKVAWRDGNGMGVMFMRQ